MTTILAALRTEGHATVLSRISRDAGTLIRCDAKLPVPTWLITCWPTAIFSLKAGRAQTNIIADAPASILAWKGTDGTQGSDGVIVPIGDVEQVT